MGFTVSDTGLGVSSLTISDELSGALQHSWKTNQGCIGVAGSPCPRTWNSTDVAQPSVGYDPSVLPQGVGYLKVVGQDPVGNKSATSYAQIKVDHAAPALELGGTLTEQASVGTLRPEYTLKVKASDGDVASPEALAPIGPAGTGEAKPQRPLGIAADHKGNVYMVDRENNRVLRFSEAGSYLGQFGSTGTGDGQFLDARGIAVTTSGDVWVSDVATGRIQKFSPSGQFLGKFGTKGEPDNSGFKFSEAYGLATGPGGALWVTDTGARRVSRFEETTEGVRFAGYAYNGTPATGQPAIIAPVGIAVDSAGNAWVVDNGGSRIHAFDPSGGYLTYFGSEGTGDGQLKAPVGIAVAPSGHLLVTDGLNNRVQVFMPTGAYLRQFGATGLGSGQLSEPRGIALGAENKVFVADAGNRRIARWSHADLDRQAGAASVIIKVDGKVVDSAAPGCPTQACTLERDWTYKAADFPTGKHVIDVVVVDSAGISMTKSLTINSVKDITPPQLTTSGSLFSVPEGWVEQKSYGYFALASDAGGYGVTSLMFKIDNSPVAIRTQTCENGGCGTFLWNALNAAQYDGGAHSGEIIATDAAGNVSTKAWTMNVDPKGTVSTSEATATLEAVDATSPSNLVGSAQEESAIYGTASGLEMEEADEDFVAVGSAAPTVIDSNPAQGFTVQTLPDGALAGPCGEESTSPEEEAAEFFDSEEGPVAPSCEAPESQASPFALTPVDITPVGIAPGSGDVTLTDAVAALSVNTAPHVDTITRPLYEGAMTFEAIRDSLGPEVYEWEVALSPDQELKLLDTQHAAVYYEGGHPAFGITAIAAHDAVGASIETALTVSGNILRLAVKHRNKSAVYPVVGGVGWQGGFVTTTVEGPKDEQELREERERIEREEREAREAEEEGAEVVSVLRTDSFAVVRVKAEGPPVAVASGSGPDNGWEHLTHAKKFKFRECYYDVEQVPTPEIAQFYIDAEEQCKKNYGWTRLQAKLSVHGWFRTNRAIERVWIGKGNLHCDKWGPDQPAKVNCEKRPDHAVKSPNTIELYGNYRFWPGDGPAYIQPPAGSPGTSACVTVRGAMEYGEGTHARDADIRPARQGTPCNWP